MENTFLTGINIRKVRHLHDIMIPISKVERKNFILTGKNGSGKTSVLESLTKALEYCVSDSYETEGELYKRLSYWQNMLKTKDDTEIGRHEKEKINNNIELLNKRIENWTDGCNVFCTSISMLREKYKRGI